MASQGSGPRSLGLKYKKEIRAIQDVEWEKLDTADRATGLPAEREDGGQGKQGLPRDHMGVGRRPGEPAEPLIERRPVGTDQPEPADFR